MLKHNKKLIKNLVKFVRKNKDTNALIICKKNEQHVIRLYLKSCIVPNQITIDNRNLIELKNQSSIQLFSEESDTAGKGDVLNYILVFGDISQDLKDTLWPCIYPNRKTPFIMNLTGW